MNISNKSIGNIIRMAHATFILLTISSCYAQESSAPNSRKTEAQRLESVRNLIRSEVNPRLHSMAQSSSAASPACQRMLEDLMQSQKFKSIEPLAILEQNYYPSHQIESSASSRKNKTQGTEIENLLGKKLTHQIQRCANEPEELGGRHAAYFEGFSPLAGSSPYVLYSLPENIKPYQNADLFFRSLRKSESNLSINYTWVNLEKCSNVAGATPVSSNQFQPDPKFQEAVVTSYENELAIWSVVRHFSFQVEIFSRSADEVHPARQTCLWSTFQ